MSYYRTEVRLITYFVKYSTVVVMASLPSELKSKFEKNERHKSKDLLIKEDDNVTYDAIKKENIDNVANDFSDSEKRKDGAALEFHSEDGKIGSLHNSVNVEVETQDVVHDQNNEVDKLKYLIHEAINEEHFLSYHTPLGNKDTENDNGTDEHVSEKYDKSDSTDESSIEDTDSDEGGKVSDNEGEIFSKSCGIMGDFVKYSENKKFKCDLCGKGFPRRTHLENHKVVHTGERNFKCDSCDKKFSRKSTLVRHQVVHSGLKKYECPVCGKDFFRKAHMIEHTLIHSGIKNFICELCGKGFSLRSHLTSHMFSHTQIKRFNCEVCQKGFSMKSGLVKHRRVHTGEKRFKCNLCEKYFSQSSVLSKHILIHTGEKKFACEVCGRLFSHKSKVTVHMRVHTKEKNYVCDICDFRFSLKSNLERHKIVHSGERNHKCHICHKTFAQKAHLKGHMVVHSDNRDYECPVCKKKYLRYASFKKHIDKNHLDGSNAESFVYITDEMATTSSVKVETPSPESRPLTLKSEILDEVVDDSLPKEFTNVYIKPEDSETMEEV